MKKIYCDLDGVLVEFEHGAIEQMRTDIQYPNFVPIKCKKHFNKMLKALGPSKEIFLHHISRDSKKCKKEVRDYMYARLKDNEDFWSNLEWTKDGKKLWDYITSLDNEVVILTSPMNAPGSHRGKERWVKNNLGANIEVFLEEKKYLHASPNNVLIDDTEYQVRNWENSKGVSVHHKTTEVSIKELQAILDE